MEMLLAKRNSSPPKELDHDKVQCCLGFLDDALDDALCSSPRMKSKSDFLRRPSEVDTPLPTDGLLGRLAKMDHKRSALGKSALTLDRHDDCDQFSHELLQQFHHAVAENKSAFINKPQAQQLTLDHTRSGKADEETKN
jgi:hypothetical protein